MDRCEFHMPTQARVWHPAGDRGANFRLMTTPNSSSTSCLLRQPRKDRSGAPCSRCLKIQILKFHFLSPSVRVSVRIPGPAFHEEIRWTKSPISRLTTSTSSACFLASHSLLVPFTYSEIAWANRKRMTKNGSRSQSLFG